MPALPTAGGGEDSPPTGQYRGREQGRSLAPLGGGLKEPVSIKGGGTQQDGMNYWWSSSSR